jgi:hypothetical protein
MYIPKGAVSLDKIEMPQIRLGIQGASNRGKTWASTTFPNVTFAQFDRGLGAHVGRKDILEVPFYDPTFVDSIVRRTSATNPPNRRDAFEKWLNSEATKFEPDQTLVIDGSTGIQSAFHTQEALEPTITSKGKVDDFAEWAHKIDYFNRLVDVLKSLRCHVVYICHETPARNDKGEFNGKLRPLLSGQFGDQLASHFTDWFRQLAFDKPENLDKVKLEQFGCKSKQEFTDLLNTNFPPPLGTAYWWQTESDDLFDAKVASLINVPRFIPANFNSFKKYMRQKIST